MSRDAVLPQRLPAVLLKLWSRGLGLVDDLVASWRLPGHEVARVGPGLYALMPSAGEAELVETAVVFARRIFRASPAGSQVRALVLPGKVRRTASGVVLLDNPLLGDLDRQPPQLADREVYLTGHAAWELEGGWATKSHATYRGPSGRSCTVLTLTEPKPQPQPWRNPELLARVTRTAERHAIRKLRDVANRPVIVVVGPFGSGKTRALAAALADQGSAFWYPTWGARSGGPPLEWSVAAQLSRFESVSDRARIGLSAALQGTGNGWQPEPPSPSVALIEAIAYALFTLTAGSGIRLVFDDFHRARPFDQRLASMLLEHPALGQRFQLALVGRSGGGWAEHLLRHDPVTVSAMDEGEAEGLWHLLVDGLSMPATVRATFFERAAGFPWAQEDSLLQLVRRRLLRQLYGNFFFSGPNEIEFETTPRLLRHLQAEALRLGPIEPLLALACTDSSLPAAIPAKMAEGDIERSGVRWHQDLLDSGLVSEERSPWGPAIRFACPAYARALRATLDDEEIALLRRAVAESLQTGPEAEAGAWERYELLAGSEEAIPALLQAARHAVSEQQNRQLFDAVRHEIEHHRQRGGAEATELELLWVLLPLARRISNLRNLDSAIDRALQLAAGDRRRRLALLTLKAEHEQNGGHLKRAEECMLESLELARGASTVQQSLLLVQLGKLLQRQDRFSEARQLFESFLPNVDLEGSPALAATCRFHLGNIALREQRLDIALDYHQQALRLRQEHRLDQHLGSSLAAIGSLNLASGNYPRALNLFQESREVLEEFGAPGETAYALLGTGRALARLGDYLSAAKPFREALELREGTDDQTGEAIARLEVAGNQLAIGHLDAAMGETRRAHFQLTLLESSRQVGDAERLLGQIQLRMRQVGAAARHFENAFECHRQRGHLLESTFDRAFLLEAAVAADDQDEIDRLCLELERVLTHIEYPALGEQLDLRLYRGLEWLERRQVREVDSQTPLKRAYEGLCRKTELLDPSLRNRFLFQIPDHRAIIDAATSHGLATRSLA